MQRQHLGPVLAEWFVVKCPAGPWSRREPRLASSLLGVEHRLSAYRGQKKKKPQSQGGSHLIFDICDGDVFLAPFPDTFERPVLRCEFFSFSFLVDSENGERRNE